MQQSSEFHWPSAFQFGGSLVAILILWGTAATLALICMIGIVDGGMDTDDIAPLLLLSAGITLAGALLLPSTWYSLMRLLGRSRQDIKTTPQHTILSWIVFPLILFPLVLASGNWVTKNTELGWLLLPPIHIFAIGLPILWLAYLGVRGLSVGSSQRDWGALGAGLTLSPMLIMLLEIFTLIVVLVSAMVYIATQPDLLNQIDILIQRLSYAPSDPQVIQRILSPYLFQPGVIYTIFAFVVVIVPLIEEALKPIGVWLLFRTGLNPTAGFTAGVLGGAGYAIFENIMFSITMENWMFVVSARSGTAVMHIFTGGITGWALAAAWRYRKYLQLGLTYLAAVAIHALWNGLTLFGIANEFIFEEQLQNTIFTDMVEITPVGLGILALVCLSLLIYTNWTLRRNHVHFFHKNSNQKTPTKFD